MIKTHHPKDMSSLEIVRAHSVRYQSHFYIVEKVS